MDLVNYPGYAVLLDRHKAASWNNMVGHLGGDASAATNAGRRVGIVVGGAYRRTLVLELVMLCKAV